MKKLIFVLVSLTFLFLVSGCNSDSPEDLPSRGGTTTIPQTPENPESPDTPVEPDSPTSPESPDTPVEPDTPTEPETPTQPDEPTQPETPDTPEDEKYPATLTMGIWPQAKSEFNYQSFSKLDYESTGTTLFDDYKELAVGDDLYLYVSKDEIFNVQKITWTRLGTSKKYVADKVLFACQFNYTDDAVYDEDFNELAPNTFSVSDAKLMLNSTFCNYSFNIEEKEKIDGEIQLITIQEAQDYFDSTDQRKKSATEFAHVTGCTNVENGCWYWTMTGHERGDSFVSTIASDGTLGNAMGVTVASGGIVPVITLK